LQVDFDQSLNLNVELKKKWDARKYSDTGGKIYLAKYLEFRASKTCLKGSKLFYAWSQYHYERLISYLLIFRGKGMRLA